MYTRASSQRERGPEPTAAHAASSTHKLLLPTPVDPVRRLTPQQSLTSISAVSRRCGLPSVGASTQCPAPRRSRQAPQAARPEAMRGLCCCFCDSSRGVCARIAAAPPQYAHASTVVRRHGGTSVSIPTWWPARRRGQPSGERGDGTHVISQHTCITKALSNPREWFAQYIVSHVFRL